MRGGLSQALQKISHNISDCCRKAADEGGLKAGEEVTAHGDAGFDEADDEEGEEGGNACDKESLVWIEVEERLKSVGGKRDEADEDEGNECEEAAFERINVFVGEVKFVAHHEIDPGFGVGGDDFGGAIEVFAFEVVAREYFADFLAFVFGFGFEVSEFDGADFLIFLKAGFVGEVLPY